MHLHVARKGQKQLTPEFKSAPFVQENSGIEQFSLVCLPIQLPAVQKPY